MKYLLTLLGFLTLSVAFAQTSDSSSTDKTSPFVTVEQMPEFPGGIKAMYQFIAENLTYPKEAAKANIEGKVFVAFIVSCTGEIQEVQVSKGIGYGCDEECVRVVRSMPRWTPGRQSGKDIPVRYSIPFSFTLRKERKTRIQLLHKTF